MRKLTALVLGIGLASGSYPAIAADQAASGGIITNRDCNQPAGQTCVITPATLTREYAGGVGTGLANARSNMNGTGASASQIAEFGSDYLPILRLSSFAGANTRTGSSVVALRSFTYTGDRAINLAINGLLDFIGSGDAAGGEFANDGQLFAGIRLMPLSLLAELTPGRSGQSIIEDFSLTAGCGSGALAGSDYSSAGTGPGAQTATLALSSYCGGGAIVINPGDQFLVAVIMQSISNRNGFMDATHTFRTVYDSAATTFVDTGESVGAGYLERVVTSAIPEPATWGMMLLGMFGAAGALRRERSRRAPLTA